jgi:hypothetical protein
VKTAFSQPVNTVNSSIPPDINYKETNQQSTFRKIAPNAILLDAGYPFFQSIKIFKKRVSEVVFESMLPINFSILSNIMTPPGPVLISRQF